MAAVIVHEDIHAECSLDARGRHIAGRDDFAYYCTLFDVAWDILRLLMMPIPAVLRLSSHILRQGSFIYKGFTMKNLILRVDESLFICRKRSFLFHRQRYK